MEFVVTTLVTHFGLTRDQAIAKMLDIHNTGGALIALASATDAHRIADALSAEARAAGHSLVCRYAGAEEETLENPANRTDSTQHPEDQSADPRPTTMDGERLKFDHALRKRD